MISKLFKIAIIFFCSLSYAQVTSQEKLEMMKNAMVLGQETRGLELGFELISLKEYKDVREESLFILAEYHFAKSFLIKDDKKVYPDISIAFNYYSKLMSDYPGGKLYAVAETRIGKLQSDATNAMILNNLFGEYYAEARIVRRNIELTHDLYKLRNFNNYAFLLKGNSSVDAITILERYYDDIVVNHPEFEMYGYYWKFLANLSKFEGFEFFIDGYLEFDVKKYNLFFDRRDKASEVFNETKTKLNGWLSYLNSKYPSHPVTLELNMLMANILLTVNRNKTDSEIQKYFEFIVQNEKDKSHPRYLLSKDFLLNNKFE